MEEIAQSGGTVRSERKWLRTMEIKKAHCERRGFHLYCAGRCWDCGDDTQPDGPRAMSGEGGTVQWQIGACKECIEERFDASILEVMHEGEPRRCAFCEQVRQPLYIVWMPVWVRVGAAGPSAMIYFVFAVIGFLLGFVLACSSAIYFVRFEQAKQAPQSGREVDR